MAKTIEKRTADTILQEPMEVKVGGKVYEVAPPCGATLMMVSALIPEMPMIDRLGNKLYETLAYAKDCEAMYRIVATLIIGAKAIRDERLAARRWPIGRRRSPTSVDRLAEELKYECTNAEVYAMVTDILSDKMEVSDFFALSASLREIGLLQTARKGAETITTALGQ